MKVDAAGRARGGFTLVELLVGLLILGLLAGVMVPQVVSRLRQGETATLAQNLSAVSRAAYAFQKDVGRFPGRLEYLATTPSAAQSSCLTSIANVSAWKGPYLARQIPATGLVSGSYVISNTLRRVPANTSATLGGLLYFDVPGVDREVADRLEAAFDGNADFAAGTISWSSATGTLSYAMPVRGC
jgi:type II secretion system protein G